MQPELLASGSRLWTCCSQPPLATLPWILNIGKCLNTNGPNLFVFDNVETAPFCLGGFCTSFDMFSSAGLMAPGFCVVQRAPHGPFANGLDSNDSSSTSTSTSSSSTIGHCQGQRALKALKAAPKPQSQPQPSLFSKETWVPSPGWVSPPPLRVSPNILADCTLGVATSEWF